MLDWLIRLARRVARGNGDSRPHGPHLADPLAGVRHPITRRPGGNAAGIAVEEPDDEPALTIIGASK